MKGITQKHYQALVLSCVDSTGHGVEVDSKEEKINFLANTLKAEMGWLIARDGVSIAAQNWLQGLASACTIPFYWADVYKWAESILGRELTSKERDTLEGEYWQNAGNALVILIPLVTRNKWNSEGLKK